MCKKIIRCIVVKTRKKVAMAKWFASLRAIFSLLFTLQPAKPFAASQGKVEALMRRNDMRYPESLLASNIGPLDKEIPPTIIGRGSKIRAEKFSSMNSIIVEGELDVLYLECGHQAAIHVTSTGRLTGKVSGGVLVTVDGKLEGSVECYELVVGPRGVVTGDVICKDV
jgi:cytoskeletal protein CcmA (bactofilin family)